MHAAQDMYFNQAKSDSAPARPVLLIWEELSLMDSLLQHDPRHGLCLLPGQAQVTRN